MKLEELFTKSLAAKGADMALKMGDVDTGESLTVMGGEASEVQRARMEWASTRGMVKLENEDDIDKLMSHNEEHELIDIKFASALVIGWSFKDKFTKKLLEKLLHENKGLATVVIGFAYSIENFKLKESKSS